jgi:hypothetical protein
MNRKLQKAFYAFIPAILSCMAISNQASASGILTVYMDSVTMFDTVYTCDGYDQIKFIPSSAIDNNIFWIWQNDDYYRESDTVYADTFSLDIHFKGEISCQGKHGITDVGKWIYIQPLVLLAEDQSGSCSSIIQLTSLTNYSGPGEPLYNWSPSTDLSNPNSKNPTVTLTHDTEFTLTLTIPNGCAVTKNVNVSLYAHGSPDICFVSIDKTDKNVIYWQKPALNYLDSFYVYKETNATNIYTKIGSLSYQDNSVFIDKNSFPLIQSNKYYVTQTDKCGNETEKGTPHKTMHLAINQGLNNAWNLIWEPYQGFEVTTYYIYRGTTPENLSLIGSTAGGSSQYTDFTAPGGFLYYQIEVISPLQCYVPDLKTTQILLNTSRSNIATNNSSGIKDNKDASAVYSLYPNPFHDKIVLKINDEKIKCGTLEINDIAGKRIKIIEINSPITEIDNISLKEGLYIVKVSTSKGIFTQTMISK